MRIIDLDRYLWGHPLFEELRADAALFRAASIECGTIVWPNDADICPDVLYLDLHPNASEEEWRAAKARRTSK